MNSIRASMAVVCALAIASAAHAQGNVNQRAVPSGTRFLASLDAPLSTKDARAGDHFEAETLERLVAIDRTILPTGTAIRGHVDKVEGAHKTGRARLWLTFDEVRTPSGWMPIVAVVDDVPGVHSIRVDEQREGEIEAQSDPRRDAEAAAAAGALVGAATGVASRNAKAAAAGAAVAAVTAYMVATGLGQEVTLDKMTKLELTLERDLPISTE
ncbi:MAG TPA: hypothetical protein VN727_14310 [Candidatus Binatia bacterium]|nr:hypothetical protein [Candidatus Binatia bacterium]